MPSSVLMTKLELGHVTPCPNFAFFYLVTLVVNLHAKSEFSITNRSRDIVGGPKFQK